MKKPIKKSSVKLSAKAETPVFPQTLHRLRKNPAAVAGGSPKKLKAEKRDNIFSKSRDTREDRGERKMKTSSNPQSFPHGR